MTKAEELVVTKMNWNRVRDWDRVRGDLSHMELMDERDEQWLERERWREDRRRERLGLGPSPQPHPVAELPKPATVAPANSVRPMPPSPRTSAVKEALVILGVSRAQLTSLYRVNDAASVGLTSLPKAQRNKLVAERMQISVAELRNLRRAFAGVACDQSAARRTALELLAREGR